MGFCDIASAKKEKERRGKRSNQKLRKKHFEGFIFGLFLIRLLRNGKSY
jgi:hypothetical protein